MAQEVILRPNDVLVPVKHLKDAGFPEGRLLVLDARKSGFIATILIDRPRSPKWASVELLARFVREGALTIEKFSQPPSSLTPISALTPAGLSEFNARKAAMKPLVHGDGGLKELLFYPGEFSRVCSKFAKQHGFKRQWIEKLAWMWLVKGRTDSAFVGARDKAGGPGKKRGFTDVVGGPRQKDGPAYDVIAAAPYSVLERAQLQEMAERLRKKLGRAVSQEEYGLRLRAMAMKNGMAPPSHAQAVYFLRDYKERKKIAKATGLLHRRYRGGKYASQDAEVDSTQCQVFTKSEIAEDVRLKNPVLYVLTEAKHNYIAAVYLTYSAPSPAALAEVLLRSLAGMADICKEYGLPYTDKVFPPLPPSQKLWADNQELLCKKLNTAVLTHLGTQIELALVGEGADKGKVEGDIGKVKRNLKPNIASFDKHAIGRALDRARKGTRLDFKAFERELIRIAFELNHMELPADKVPREFIDTRLPVNRVELFKWDMARTPELVRSIPSKDLLPKLILPTDWYPVHAGEGIYIKGRYYTSVELVADGFLRKRARGATPQVQVAEHLGTTNFVYWVRGKCDLVKCVLQGGQEDALGNMTVVEADDHMASLPSQAKRERLRRVNSQSHQSAPQTKQDRKALSDSAKKGHITKNRGRIDAVRRAEAQLQNKRDAHRRFPSEVASPDVEQEDAPMKAADTFADEQANQVARWLKQRQETS